MPFIAPKSENPAKIKVIGVGGGGQNAINTMVSLSETYGVEYIAMNTDLQALNSCDAPTKLQLGPGRTHGLGSGADPSVGQDAAFESAEDVKKLLEGANMVFVAAGLGGGTGTGASPVVAQIAKELGILTVGVVTKPFVFEGKRRMAQADQGIKDLKSRVDALIVIPNEKLLEVVEEKTSMQDAFKVVDRVVGNAVKGISDLITSAGLINVDFADIETVMSNAGSALMGIGKANGENRAEKAAKMAINSPLLGIDIKGSTGILLNIVGDATMTMHEVNTAAKLVSESANENANIIFGANIDPTVDGVQVTVIATGFDSDFKDISIPNNSTGISDRDVIEQIDSRFDNIKKKPVVVEEEVEELEEKVEQEKGRDFSFDEIDASPKDDTDVLKNLRKEVEEMEKKEKPSKDKSPFDTEEDDSDEDASDDTKSNFWNFMKDRKK
ncbi:MAG: cell division protein FtsZ [Patescibacteria group bacterium]|nr:cell division protein FtsZ [Patescibacteria group bacterium]